MHLYPLNTNCIFVHLALWALCLCVKCNSSSLPSWSVLPKDSLSILYNTLFKQTISVIPTRLKLCSSTWTFPVVIPMLCELIHRCLRQTSSNTVYWLEIGGLPSCCVPRHFLLSISLPAPLFGLWSPFPNLDLSVPLLLTKLFLPPSFSCHSSK